MHQPHQRADHPLDDAAEMRLTRRPPLDGDAMLGTAALESLGMELGAIVDAQPARLAGHRPFALDTAQREPGRLVHCGVRQAQPDRGGRRCFERDMKAGDAPAVSIDGDRQPGPSDRFAVNRIDKDQIHRRVIDLQQIERVPGGRRMAVYRLGLGVLLAAAAQVGERQRLEPAPDRAGRGWTQPFLAAAPDDFLDDARSPASLRRQIAFLYNPAKRRLGRGRHPRRVPAAARSAGQQRRQRAAGVPTPAQQGVGLTLRQAQRSRGGLDQVARPAALFGERADHFGPALGLAPSRLRDERQVGHTNPQPAAYCSGL